MLRRSSIVPALLISVLAAAGCTSNGTVNLVMTLASGTSRTVGPGHSIVVNIQGQTINGFSVTPARGTVNLTVSPADAGTLSSASVSLDASGNGTVTFTMCTEGPDCTPGAAVKIAGELVAQGQTATNTVQLTVGSSIQLVMAATPAPTNDQVKPGQSLTISLAACNTGGTPIPVGGSCTGTPVAGTVSLTATNGSVSTNSVMLDGSDGGSTSDGGGATVTFTVCGAMDTGCTNSAKSTLTGTFTPSGSSTATNTATDTLSFTIFNPTGGADGGDAGTGVVSNGQYALALSITNSDGSAFDGRVPAGGSTLAIVATLTGANVGSQKVSFGVTGNIGTVTAETATDGGFVDAGSASPVQATTDSTGNAYALFTSEDNGGAAMGNLTVTFVDPTGSTLNASQQIAVVVPGALLFNSQATGFTSVMGVKYSGYNEQDTFAFTLVDSTGQPYTSPVDIQFSVPALGGARVSPTDILTDPTGQAITTVYSGTAAGTLAVTASAAIKLGTHTFPVQVTSPTVAVVGAKASARNVSISCDHYSVPALWGNDCSFMHVDVTPTCTAVIGDRFGNVLGRAEEVTWLSEAGLFGPPSSTTAAAPGGDPTSEPLLGHTSNSLHMLNATLPADVPPQTGEPQNAITAAQDACGPRIANPRDGLVTFIAATQGEEGFIDANENGKWDPGETFFDQGEPYVDSNDNNHYDFGEPWIDVNGDGVYNPPNGVWDADTTIWAQSHIVVTGKVNAAWTPDPLPIVPFGTSTQFAVTWADENLNDPSPTYSTYSTQLLAPSQGTATLDSPTMTLPDKLGQMSVFEPTSCATAPRNDPTSMVCASSITCSTNADCPTGGSCAGSVCLTPCYCTLSTAIRFDGPVVATNNYQAPAMQPTMGISDTIQSVLTESVGPNTITTPDNRQVVWMAGSSSGGNGSDGGSVSSSGGSYALSMTVKNADGSTFNGRVPAGSLPLPVTVTLTQGGVGVASQQVTLSLTGGIGTLTGALADGGSSGSGTTITLTTNSQGIAQATFTPESTGAAVGDILAAFADAATNTSIQVPQQVTVVVPGAIAFTPGANDAFYTVMGVKHSGFREQNTFRFTVLDSTGQPYLGGAKIHFSVPVLGGATVSPTDIFTDQNGQAVTTVYSGTSAGTLAVTASTSIQISASSTINLQTTSETVAVVGAKAFGRNFSISCADHSVPALWGNDCSYMHVDVSPTCTAVIGDRYGNVLGIPGEVTWLSEAGLFGPPSFTPEATPGADPTTEPLLGRTQNSLRLLNTPLPEDVAPWTGTPASEPVEPFQSVNSCGTRIANPRDGLITFVAATQGEEGFVDSNDNGQWDPGEPFYDQGEPYVDSNDNNQYDTGEPYIDVNGNGMYDGPNGVWDSNTTIWTWGHMAVTGAPGAQWYVQPGDQPWQAGTAWPLSFGQSVAFDVFWRDENMNDPSPLFSTYQLQLLAPAGGTVTLDTPTNFVDDYGQMGAAILTSCATTSGVDGGTDAGQVCGVANTHGGMTCATSSDCPSSSTCVSVGSSSQCLTDCYCTESSRISFTGTPPSGFAQEVGTYTAPAATTSADGGTVGTGGVDTIKSSVSESVGGSTINTEDVRAVQYN